MPIQRRNREHQLFSISSLTLLSTASRSKLPMRWGVDYVVSVLILEQNATFRSFSIVCVCLSGCFFRTTTEKHPGFQKSRIAILSLYSMGNKSSWCFRNQCDDDFDIAARLERELISVFDTTMYCVMRSYFSILDKAPWLIYRRTEIEHFINLK